MTFLAFCGRIGGRKYKGSRELWEFAVAWYMAPDRPRAPGSFAEVKEWCDDTEWTADRDGLLEGARQAWTAWTAREGRKEHAA